MHKFTFYFYFTFIWNSSFFSPSHVQHPGELPGLRPLPFLFANEHRVLCTGIGYYIDLMHSPHLPYGLPWLLTYLHKLDREGNERTITSWSCRLKFQDQLKLDSHIYSATCLTNSYFGGKTLYKNTFQCLLIGETLCFPAPFPPVLHSFKCMKLQS